MNAPQGRNGTGDDIAVVVGASGGVGRAIAERLARDPAFVANAAGPALNMLIRTLAIEHRRTRKLGVCVALHPGTVDTGLSAPFQARVPEAKLFTPDFAAASLLAVMDGLGPDANGGFFARDGAPIPW